MENQMQANEQLTLVLKSAIFIYVVRQRFLFSLIAQYSIVPIQIFKKTFRFNWFSKFPFKVF